MKKNNYIWDSIDTTNIVGDKPLVKKNNKMPLWERKERKKQRDYKRTPKKYFAYIKSKFWRKRRNKYFQMYGKKCIICKSTKFVVLHHLEYKWQVYGIEPDEMLVQLCFDHHEEFHALYGVKQKMYKEFDEFIDIKMSEGIMEYI